MAWVRLDDHIDEHPKVAVLDDHAFALFIRGLAYCNRNLTDGFIPTIIAKQKMAARTAAIASLESGGLWERVADGWQVHDYSVYQPTKQQVEEERSKKQAAGQAGGRASAQARAQAGAARVVQAESNPVPDPYPTRTQSDPLDPSLRSGDAAPKNGAARGNPRVQAVIDAFEREGYVPSLGPRDYAAIKQSTAEPETIVEVFLAVANRQWGDEFQRRRLNVHEAINWVNAYVEERAEQEIRNGAA